MIADSQEDNCQEIGAEGSEKDGHASATRCGGWWRIDDQLVTLDFKEKTIECFATVGSRQHSIVKLRKRCAVVPVEHYRDINIFR